MRTKVSVAGALLISMAPLVASATDGALSVNLAKRLFQLPFSTEPIKTPEGNPGVHVFVDLSPILMERRAVLQEALDLPHDKCGLSVKVTEVTLTTASSGAHVRIDADFTVCAFRVSKTHNSHLDATLLPVVQNRHRITFTASDGEVSGEVGRLFHEDVRRKVENGVQKSVPTFDLESVIPQTLRTFLPALEVLNVRLTGAGIAWRIEASLVLQPQ